MNATITYDLSEIGRKESLRNSGNGKTEQTVEVEISANDLELFDVSNSGDISKRITYTRGTRQYFDAPQSREQLLTYLHQEEIETKKRAAAEVQRNAEELEKSIQKLLTDGPEKLAEDCCHHLSKDEMRDERVAALVSSAQVIKDKIQRERVRARSESEKKEQLKKEQQLLEQQTAQKCKSDQIAQWVADHGTQSQKKRLAASLLPESEVVDAMREESLSPLSGQPRYEKIVASDIEELCEDPYYDRVNIDFNVATSTEASEAEFALLEQFRGLLPSGTCTLQTHTGSWDCGNDDHETHEITRKSIRVEIKVGEFLFSRLYAV